MKKIKNPHRVTTLNVVCPPFEENNASKGSYAKRSKNSSRGNNNLEQTNNNVKTVHLYNIKEMKTNNIFYQGDNKKSALDYDYITNQVTGEKINIEMNEDIKVDKIEPQKMLSYDDAKENTDTVIKRYANIAKGNKADYLLEFTLKDNGEIELYGVNIIKKEAVSKNTYPKKGSALETANYSISNIKDIFKTKLVEKYNNDHKNLIFNYVLSINKDNRGNWIVNINKINASQDTKGNNPQTLTDNNNITNTANNFNPMVTAV